MFGQPGDRGWVSASSVAFSSYLGCPKDTIYGRKRLMSPLREILPIMNQVDCWLREMICELVDQIHRDLTTRLSTNSLSLGRSKLGEFARALPEHSLD